MNIQKKDVLEALRKITAPGEGKNMVDSGAVQNIVVFGDEVVVDVVINNPSLQAKKRTEVEIMKAIHGEVHEKAKVVVNVKVIAPEVPEIKGKPIPGIQNVIAVASGKGEVGKSTVTANLAAALAKMGFKVGVLDADVYGPSIPIMFDVAGNRPQSLAINGKSFIQPIENYGVKILSIGFFTNANQAVIWRGPMASKALNQLIFESYWGELLYLVGGAIVVTVVGMVVVNLSRRISVMSVWYLCTPLLDGMATANTLFFLLGFTQAPLPWLDLQSTTLLAVMNASTAVIGYLAAERSRQLRSQEAAMTALGRYQATYRVAPIGLLFFDHENRIECYNEVAVRLFDVPAGTL